MRRIISLAGVELPNAVALPTIGRTPEGRAMGGIPGWRVLIDPAFADAGAARNRARPAAMLPRQGSAYTFGTISGQPAFAAVAGGPHFGVTTPMNPDSWSVFFVVQTPRGGASGGRELLRGNTIAPAVGNVGPRVTIRVNGTLAVIENISTNIRVNGPAIPDNIPTLLMATFSTRDGLRLFIDGALVAANPEDRRALDNEFGANQYGLLRATSAGLPLLAGMCGILDIDLGWPEHVGYRRAIEGFLMAKYGIA